MKLGLAAFLRWVGMVTVTELAHVRAEDNQRIRDEYRAVIQDLKAEHDAAMTGLIEELNDLRNSICANSAQTTKPPVRRLRNWQDFRAAAEGTPAKSIRIERTS